MRSYAQSPAATNTHPLNTVSQTGDDVSLADNEADDHVALEDFAAVQVSGVAHRDTGVALRDRADTEHDLDYVETVQHIFSLGTDWGMRD